MAAGVNGIPGLPALVSVQRDSEYVAALVTQQEVMTARETTLKLNPANLTQSVSFDTTYNSVTLFLATIKYFCN